MTTRAVVSRFTFPARAPRDSRWCDVIGRATSEHPSAAIGRGPPVEAKQAEAILRLLRKLPPGAGNDFVLSTAGQIIATFDRVSSRIGLVAVGLAAVSLLMGAIGIANVMFISVTERTRAIGLRLVVGARRRQVLTQFLLDAAFLSGIGGRRNRGVRPLVSARRRSVFNDNHVQPGARSSIAAVHWSGVPHKENNVMPDTRIVLITGATGKQGGAVARHLTGRGFKIRAMTRQVDSDAAKALAATGAEVVKGDLNDAASLEAALTGAWGAFAVQNTWEAGVEGEEEQGKRFAMAARKVGIQHFVYSSVGSAQTWP